MAVFCFKQQSCQLKCLTAGAAVREVPDHGKAPSIRLHESYPTGTSMNDACGASTGKVSQDDVERFKRYVNRVVLIFLF